MGFRQQDMARFAMSLGQKMERAALQYSDRAATETLREFRSKGQAAGMGGLVMAVGAGSDLKKGNGVHRKAGGGFSASGWLFFRSGYKRSRGALEAYLSKGRTTITAKNRSGLLWFPTEAIQRLAKVGDHRKRLTVARWKAAGMDAKVGKLVRITAADGTPLLIVENVGVRASGKARSLRRNGLPRRGDTAQKYIIAFIGIRQTTRTQRVDLPDIARSVLLRLASTARKGTV